MTFNERLALLEDARKNATQGEWKFYDTTAKIHNEPIGPIVNSNGEPIHGLNMVKSNADFIILAANHIQRVIDDARKMREAIDDLVEGFEGHFGEGFWESKLGLKTKKMLEELDREDR